MCMEVRTYSMSNTYICSLCATEEKILGNDAVTAVPYLPSLAWRVIPNFLPAMITDCAGVRIYHSRQEVGDSTPDYR